METNHHPAARLALALLAIAAVAMLTLHGVQPQLDPFAEPVSYYVHGEHGWLLDLALISFGAAACTSAFARGESSPNRAGRWALIVFGAGMIVAGLIPSDRWFPWEARPTLSGVIHAAVSVVSPPLLLVPMLHDLRRSERRRVEVPCVIAYALGLVGSALALAIGFILDQPPPLIGLSERVLALAGVAWLATHALGETPARIAAPG